MAFRLPDILAGVLRRPSAARRVRRPDGGEGATPPPAPVPAAAPSGNPEPIVDRSELFRLRRELEHELEKLAARSVAPPDPGAEVKIR